MSMKHEIKTSVEFEPNGARRYAFFNRFALEPCEEHAVLHFGLVRQGFAPDVYSCFMTRFHLNENRKRLRGFLVDIGMDDVRAEDSWMPPAQTGSIDCVSMIHMCRTDDMGEITMYSFALHPLIKKSTESTGALKLKMDMLAVLRCDLPLMRMALIKFLGPKGAA